MAASRLRITTTNLVAAAAHLSATASAERVDLEAANRELERVDRLVTDAREALAQLVDLRRR